MHFKDIAHLLFFWTLGMPSHAGLNPIEMATFIYSFHECLAAYKNFKTTI